MSHKDIEVTYLDHMGNDNSVVNAARVSFNKEASQYSDDRNSKLITYLAEHKHEIPFAHTAISVRVLAPISIRTQAFKHKVGFVENECFDEQTQVLTNTGWKYWAEVTKDDMLAVPSKDFQTYTFEKPKALIIQDYKGVMLHCHSRHLDMLCTPNHEQPVSYYCQKSGRYWTDYTKIKTKDVRDLHFAKLPPLPKLATERNGGYDYGFFQGVFLGDGSLSKDGKRIYFHIKKERKKEMLRELMQRTPELNWVENPQDDGYSYFRCYNKYEFTGNTTDKFIDWRMESSEYYQGLFDGLIATDGCISKDGSISYSTVSKQLWQDFLQLCEYVGRETKTHIRDNVPNWNATYKVTAKKNTPKLLKNIEEVYYEGKVYCAETSTNLLYVRRNGKANISGNCSRRYITDTPRYYIPTLRLAPSESIKQGSGDLVPLNPRNDMQTMITKHYKDSIELYEYLLGQNVAPEQARFVLPQGVMTEWVWTGSLLAFARFYNLRSDSHAQKEIQELARLVSNVIQPLFPVSWKALTGVDKELKREPLH